MKKVISILILGLLTVQLSACSLFARDKVVNEQSLALSGIDTLQISYGAGHVTILPGDSNSIEIKEYMSQHKRDYDAEIQQNGNLVTITNGQRPPDPTFTAKISVYIPASYSGSITIETVGGSITSQSVYTLKDFTVISESGGIDCSNITANSLRLVNNSGGIDGRNLNGPLDITSQSGSTRLFDLNGSGIIAGGEGRMEITFAQITDSISISTTSGRLDLKIPQDTSANFSAATNSGSIEVSLPGDIDKGETTAQGILGSAPQFDITLSSTSGRIQVGN
ncbi:DUF4097 domain-containing protein [Ruminococcaceae bacterium OttesenSCG-928-D13]|nr:DUF4097 domain-containing protein [Ruminococcaceae bacterium OttesenSCG-928-D13]